MRNFQDKRRWRQILQSKPVLALLGVMVLVFAWSIFGLAGRMQETIKNKNIAEAKILDLQKEKEALSSDIDKLKTNKGIEENIREKFGLAKDGEGMIVVLDDKNQPKTGPENKPAGFFSFLKNWFK